MTDEVTRAAPPVLRKEVVSTTTLGEVVVRAMKLSERIAMNREAKSAADAATASDQFVARLLSRTVTDKAGAQYWSVDEWDIFAATNQDEANQLLDVSMRLNGFDGADAKND